MSIRRSVFLGLLAGAAVACEAGDHGPVMRPAVPPLTTAAQADTGLAKLRQDAKALEPLVLTPWVKSFLRATDALPHIAPRTIYEDATREHAYSSAEVDRMPEEARRALRAIRVDDAFYYTTKYGSPLAYARALDLIAQRADVPSIAGRKLLDFGYGGIGHLRLLASLGASMHAVDVDPLLRILYGAPGDQGPVPGFEGAPAGSITLTDGRSPVDPAVRAAVGVGYDGVLSKNTLKRGTIHPEQPADDRYLIHLGVDDAAFVGALATIVKPGGFVMLYNIGPAPAPPGKPYMPLADGRSPFSASTWEHAGFEVLAFDADDTPAVRAQARALAWDRDPDAPIDIDRDLFATYTLVRR